MPLLDSQCVIISESFCASDSFFFALHKHTAGERGQHMANFISTAIAQTETLSVYIPVFYLLYTKLQILA